MLSNSAKGICVGQVCLPVWACIVEPVGILGPVTTVIVKLDATIKVVFVQDLDGGQDLRVRDVSSLDGVVLMDHMPYTKFRRQLR